jgi:hypothetical protein
VDSTPEQLVQVNFAKVIIYETANYFRLFSTQLLALRSPAPSVSKITSLAQFESQFRAKITGGVDKFSQVPIICYARILS